MKRYIFLVVALLSSLNLWAQVNTISGIVYDSLTKEPVVYASVGLVGSFQGTATNDDGAFTLIYSCVDSCKVKITSLGYYSKEISIDSITDTLWMRPSTKVLKELVINSKDVSAYSIVKKAIKSIDDNYISDPFTIKAFYRHYCQDSGVYVRLIESAFDLYQKRGYKKSNFKKSRFTGQLRLVQMRRLNNKYDNGLHPPISIRSALTDDIIGSHGNVYPLALETSFYNPIFWDLDLLKEGFEFDLDKIIYTNDKKVYVISFKKLLYESNGQKGYQMGKLYIDANSFAILKYKFENENNTGSITSGYSITEYKKYGDKYALFRVERERYKGKLHVDHIELLNTKLTIGKSKLDYNSNITREMLADVSYTPGFWNSYNVLKRNKTEQKIFEDLGNKNDLEIRESFVEVQTRERISLEEEQEGKRKYDSLLKNNEGLMVVIFWRNWSKGGPSDKFLESIERIEDYRKLGYQFVFISVDNNRDTWLQNVKKLNLQNDINLRRGYKEFRKEYKKETNSQHLIKFPVIRLYNGTYMEEEVRTLTWELMVELSAKYKVQKQKEL